MQARAPVARPWLKGSELPFRKEMIAEGYEYQLDSTAMTLQEVTEWMSIGTTRYPFLTAASTAINEEGWVLTVSGAEGMKVMLMRHSALTAAHMFRGATDASILFRPP